jgi:hypothetical protein
MRAPSSSGLAVLAAALAVGPATAQQGQQPQLVLSVGFGVHTGHGLWTIDTQPLSVLGTGNPTAYDSLRLVRTISPGLVAAFSATYFASNHVGIRGSLTYLDIGMENSCEPVVPYLPDAQEANRQLCENLHGTVSGNSSIVVGGDVVLRAAPRGAVSPYLRGGIGYAFHSTGTLDVASVFVQASGQVASRQVITDETPKAGSAALMFGAGVTRTLGTGYLLRLEVRDDVLSYEAATGPADGLGRLEQPPPPRTETRWYHHWSLTLGLDVVLERRRARRY